MDGGLAWGAAVTLVYFGDSLTSPREDFQGNPKARHPDYTAEILGLPAPLNFALGGSTVLPNEKDSAKGLGSQVDLFLAEHDATGATAVLWIGGNDFLAEAAAQTYDLDIIPDMIAEIEAASARLFDAGAERVVVMGQPPATFYPAFEAEPRFPPLDPLFAAYNAELAQIEGIDFADLSGLSAALETSPGEFGIEYVTDAPRGIDRGTALFTDLIHLDFGGHQIFGAFMAAYLTGYEITFGTPGDDHALGTPGPTLRMGLEGVDHLRGGDGDDILIGGSGADRLIGGPGADIIFAGVGDQVLGSEGDDFVFVTEPGASVSGGTGVDVVFLAPGVDPTGFRDIEQIEPFPAELSAWGFFLGETT